MTPWRTSTVVGICQSMRETQDFSAVAILADALEEAEFPFPDELAQFRNPRISKVESIRLVARIFSDESHLSVIWMTDLAKSFGETCENYSEVWDNYFNQIRHLDWQRDTEELNRLSEEAQVAQRWVPITFDIVIQAGFDSLNDPDGWTWFTQKGREDARNHMQSEGNRKEFWRHWSIITGVKVPDSVLDNTVFSCSC